MYTQLYFCVYELKIGIIKVSIHTFIFCVYVYFNGGYMIYKLLKANYVNKNNVSYSEECIDKMIEQYKDKKFNVYCAEDADFFRI